MVLIPTKRSTPSGVKRSYEALVRGSRDYRLYNFRNKKFSHRAIEIESETISVRIEQEEALAGTPRRKEKCKV